MESSSRKLQEERKRQDEIRKQIALLQTQLVDLPNEEPEIPTVSRPKRRQENEGSSSRQGAILAPPTPSPKSEYQGDYACL